MSLFDRAPPTETEIDNVLYMRDFVESKLIHAQLEHTRLSEKAEELSKQKKDKFAAPLRVKAEEFEKEVERLSNHLRFIDKGGNTGTMQAPASVYRFTFPSFGPRPTIIR